MPPTVVLLVIAVLVVVALVHGYRTLTALLVLRSLPSDDTDSPPPGIDGEQVALTGDLVVETAAGDVFDTGRPVGGYLWRARFPDNTNIHSDVTLLHVTTPDQLV